jgi:site-specific recombinase XerD
VLAAVRAKAGTCSSRRQSRAAPPGGADPQIATSGTATCSFGGMTTPTRFTPVQTIAALVEYLRDRRRDAGCREVFLRAFAPHGPISVKAVDALVRHACDRGGVARVGTHRLRHTVATELLGAGAPLAEIAPILRHSNLSTTAIYAKVNRTALRSLARP